MSSSNIRRVTSAFFVGVVLSSVIGQAQATPSQIPLNVGISAAKPNIMMLVDNSGSMSTPVLIAGASTVAPNLLTGNYNCNSSREYPGGATTAANATTVITMQVFSTYAQFCPTTGVCTNNNSIGFGNGSNNKCFNATKYYNIDGLGTYTGNQLNLYFKTYNGKLFDINNLTSTGTPPTRLSLVQDAAVAFVNSLKPVGGAVPSVRLGLSRYNSSSTGADLLAAIGPLDVAKGDTIINQIKGFQAQTYTPLAESLADIGHYYTSGVGLGATVPGGYNGNLTLHPSTVPKTDTVANIFNNHNIVNSTGAVQNSPIQGACQRSNIILLTDGLPTKDQSISASFADYDGDCSGALSVNCTTYDMKKIYTYESTGSDYLDDVAQALYEMDLRPDYSKQISWQKNNITTYTIGFADPAIDPDVPGVNPLLKDTATQGGGQFYYAQDATTLADSLDNIVTDISSKISSSASVVANSAKLDINSAIFQGKFDSADWTGGFAMFPLKPSEDANGNGVLDSGEDANGNGVLDAGGVGDPLWKAVEHIPAFGSRNIITYNPDPAANPRGMPFTCANLKDSQKTTLGISIATGACNSTTDVGVLRLNYLRGDWSHEELRYGRTDKDTIRSTTAADRIFRNRTHLSKSTSAMEPPDPWLLGDIVNSNPVYVSDENYRYDKLPAMVSEGASYKAFVATKVATNPAWRKMVYVGANDGMLHGFDGNGSGTDAGKEILAYIPNAVYSGLYALTSPNYVHQYTVDGSPRVADAYYGGAWHTVLVSTTGAGGKAVFALDITNPNSFGGSNVLWEISDSQSPNASDLTSDSTTATPSAWRGFANNLGYTLPQPSIVKMKDGSWAAIVANGYDSVNNLAVLYIINIQTGNIIAAIDTKAGSAATPNGLSTPITVDTDGDKIVDAIYAGDLLGNLWKFDVSSTTPSAWGVANGGSPLFVACSNPSACSTTRQPITGKPQISGVNKKLGQKSGLMVYFGTGKYFETVDNDVSSAQTQTFYGIWDNNTTVAKTDLQVQTIIAEVAAGGFNLRATTNNTVNYPIQKGWYMELLHPSTTSSDGERVVSFPLFRGGRIIFTSMTPIPPTGTNICGAESDGTSWLMELDAYTGNRLGTPPWDISGDGKINSSDLIAIVGLGGIPPSGKQSTVGITSTPAVVTAGKLEYKYTSGSKEAQREVTTESSSGGSGLGSRQSWRQL